MLSPLPYIFQLFPNRKHFPLLFSREPPKRMAKEKSSRWVRVTSNARWRRRNKGMVAKGRKWKVIGKRVSRDNTFLPFVDNYTWNTNQGVKRERENWRRRGTTDTTTADDAVPPLGPDQFTAFPWRSFPQKIARHAIPDRRAIEWNLFVNRSNASICFERRGDVARPFCYIEPC